MSPGAHAVYDGGLGGRSQCSVLTAPDRSALLRADDNQIRGLALPPAARARGSASEKHPLHLPDSGGRFGVNSIEYRVTPKRLLDYATPPRLPASRQIC